MTPAERKFRARAAARSTARRTAHRLAGYAIEERISRLVNNVGQDPAVMQALHKLAREHHNKADKIDTVTVVQR